MKILLICPFPVSPHSLGGMMRAYRWTTYLCRRHDVTLVYFIRPDESTPLDDGPLTEAGCKIVPVHLPERSVPRQIADWLGPNPNRVNYFQTTAGREKIKELITTGNYDLVQAELSLMAEYLRPFRQRRFKTVLLEQELTLIAMSTYARVGASMIEKIKFNVEDIKFRRYERRNTALFDRIYAINNIERRALCALVPPERLGVFPNVIDADGYQVDEKAEEPGLISFVGNYEHTPNIDGVRWFVDRVWPKIIDAHPSARFCAAGANPDDYLQSLRGVRNISIPGFIPDLNAFLSKTSVFIAPLISGAGMRGKVLEAMAAKRPVVSTSIGAAGIEGVSGRDLIIADTPEEFASGVNMLLTDGRRRKSMGENGLSLVRKLYDDKVVFPRIEADYEALVAPERSIRKVSTR